MNFFSASSIRYSCKLLYVLRPTPGWKMKHCIPGAQSVPDSRLKSKLQLTHLDPICLTGLDQKLKGPVAVVGYVYMCLHFLYRALTVPVSDSPRDGSSEVIDVRFKAFYLYTPWQTVKNLHYKRCCICFGVKEAVLLIMLITVRVDVVTHNMLWRPRGKRRSII